jgi:hypothetical protein
MSDLHRISTHDLYRSAKGGKGRQVNRGRQPTPDKVTLAATFYVEIEAEETAGREWFVNHADHLTRLGATSVSMQGPELKPGEQRKPRRVQ